MNNVYLLLGSNLSDPWKQLAMARKKISEFADITRQSTVYRTAAWGKQDQPDFLNQVLIIRTELLPEDLLQRLLEIEQDMGRARTEKNAPRLIDIDILFYNADIVSRENLIIPHPHIADRRFVLTPLVEITPDFIHPISNKSVTELLSECQDPLEVKRY